MAYQITNTNGTTITVADNAVDSTYSVQLVGKNRTNYGATINQNFFRLMENFSSGSAPTSPQLGQAWFDATHSTLKVYGGVDIGWKPLSGIATSAPSGPVAGDMWFDTVNQQLKVYAGSAWVAINSGVAGGGHAPVTVTGATYTMLATDSSIIINYAGTCTVTLLNAVTYPGRILYIKTVTAHTVNSAGSNVVPVASTSASTAILAGTAGKWAMLQSDGTNWVTMMAG